MDIEEKYIFDSYMLARNLQLEVFRLPVGTKGAERNEFVLWPSGILVWPHGSGLDYMDHYVVHLFHVALEAERSGVFERIKKSGKDGSGGEKMVLLDPIEHAAQYEEHYGDS